MFQQEKKEVLLDFLVKLLRLDNIVVVMDGARSKQKLDTAMNRLGLKKLSMQKLEKFTAKLQEAISLGMESSRKALVIFVYVIRRKHRIFKSKTCTRRL